MSSVQKISYLPLSLLADKIHVLIVGGGKAAFIKAKTFVSRGCRVTIVAKKMGGGLANLHADRLTLIHAPYDSSYLSGCHLVIIAADDDALNHNIQQDCEQAHKLYLTCHDYQQGQFVMPVRRETEQAVLALHTKSGSPRTTLFLAEKLQKTLQDYDRFIEFVCDIRKQIKHRADKDDIMKAINSDEFFDLFVQGKHREFCERYKIGAFQ